MTPTEGRLARDPKITDGTRDACRLHNLFDFFAPTGLLLGVPLCVRAGEGLPLLRQVFHGENRGYRADRHTSPAINTFGRIDIKLSYAFVLWLILPRVDTV